MTTTFKYKNVFFRSFIYFICCLLSIKSAATAMDETLIPSDYVRSFLKDYSQTEKELIRDDFDNIKKLCFRGITAPENGEKTYVATAGGPGASKSTILETYLHDKPNFAYLDPDQRALKFMINTYLQDFTNYKIRETSNMPVLLQNAYEKWRGGSNYIASSLINEAFSKGYNIAHGTTSTSEHVTKLYERLKKNNYKITLLLCSSTDANRVASLQHRVKSQCFCQVDPNDIVKKGKMFPDRFPDYFQYADEIQLYWIGDFLKGGILAATLTKGNKAIVHDQAALQKITAQYEKDGQGKNLAPLQELIKKFESQR